MVSAVTLLGVGWVTWFGWLPRVVGLRREFVPRVDGAWLRELMFSVLLGPGYRTGHATGTKGTQVSSKISFFTDPGYKDTARMIVESALALSLDGEKVTSGGGVWTPASCTPSLVSISQLSPPHFSFSFCDAFQLPGVFFRINAVTHSAADVVQTDEVVRNNVEQARSKCCSTVSLARAASLPSWNERPAWGSYRHVGSFAPFLRGAVASVRQDRHTSRPHRGPETTRKCE